MARLSKIFCQRCMAANELGQELCARCGTRLMLVVEPSASRFEGGDVSGGIEEHILERISVIENSLSRLVDKLGQLADLMLRQSRTAYLDHALLDTLVDVLNEAGVIRRRAVEAAWRERYRREKPAGTDPDREEVCERARALLSEAVRRGGHSFAAHTALGRLAAAEADWKTALSEFKQALAARPCPEAHYLLGLVYYETGRDRTALKHLRKAIEFDGSYAAVVYLMGLVYERLGESRNARDYLEAARAMGVKPRRGTPRGEAAPPTLLAAKGK